MRLVHPVSFWHHLGGEAAGHPSKRIPPRPGYYGACVMRKFEIDEIRSELDGLVRKLPLSFEMFPPSTDKGRTNLATTVDRLAYFATEGFSVTMGAGGSTKHGTLETARNIAERSGRPVKAHLIALGHSREEVLKEADHFWQAGITRVLALRGDQPRSGENRRKDSYRHASNLVAALSKRHDFEISVAAYPEKHPEAASLEEDIDYLKRKLDSGASRAICQFVLQPEAYARFLDKCASRGVTAPIIPGLMPLENWPRVRALAEANGTAIPEILDRLFADLENTADARRLATMALLIEHARQFVAYGAPALHVYALNRWQTPLALARVLRRPDTASED